MSNAQFQPSELVDTSGCFSGIPLLALTQVPASSMEASQPYQGSTHQGAAPVHPDGELGVLGEARPKP